MGWDPALAPRRPLLPLDSPYPSRLQSRRRRPRTLAYRPGGISPAPNRSATQHRCPSSPPHLLVNLPIMTVSGRPVSHLWAPVRSAAQLVVCVEGLQEILLVVARPDMLLPATSSTRRETSTTIKRGGGRIKDEQLQWGYRLSEGNQEEDMATGCRVASTSAVTVRCSGDSGSTSLCPAAALASFFAVSMVWRLKEEEGLRWGYREAALGEPAGGGGGERYPHDRSCGGGGCGSTTRSPPRASNSFWHHPGRSR